MNIYINLSTARGEQDRTRVLNEAAYKLTELLNALSEIGASTIHIQVNASADTGLASHAGPPAIPGGY